MTGTGIDLSAADIDEWLKILASLSPSGKTSMLQDIEAGRKSDVALSAGHVVALRKQSTAPLR